MGLRGVCGGGCSTGGAARASGGGGLRGLAPSRHAVRARLVNVRTAGADGKF
jgi:hypothetical protein